MIGKNKEQDKWNTRNCSEKWFILSTGDLLHKVSGSDSALSVDGKFHISKVLLDKRNKADYQFNDEILHIFLENVIRD